MKHIVQTLLALAVLSQTPLQAQAQNADPDTPSKVCWDALAQKEKVYEAINRKPLPDGATPKDGPSAGAAMTTALVSALSGIPVRADVAMTGEITLRGEVTAIGGLKEKLLAAHRGGIKTVLIPEENVKDLQDIPENVKNHLEIVPVKWIDQVLQVALERMPEPLPDEEPAAAPAAVFFDAVAAVAATNLAGRRPGRWAGGPEAAAPQPTPPEPSSSPPPV
jgi:hypothetical protein